MTKMERPKNDTQARALLLSRLKESDLPAGTFATKVLLREPRTMRRWLSGESPIPVLVVDFLVEPTQRPWPNGGRRKAKR